MYDRNAPSQNVHTEVFLGFGKMTENNEKQQSKKFHLSYTQTRTTIKPIRIIIIVAIQTILITMPTILMTIPTIILATRKCPLDN